MSELTKIVKNFLLTSILILLATAVLCGVFIAKTGTENMLFG